MQSICGLRLSLQNYRPVTYKSGAEKRREMSFFCRDLRSKAPEMISSHKKGRTLLYKRGYRVKAVLKRSGWPRGAALVVAFGGSAV